MDAIPSTPFLTDTAPATLFVALELSRSTWLVAVHSPAVDKVSQHRLEGGDTKGLLELITRKRTQAAEKLGRPMRVACLRSDDVRGRGYAPRGRTPDTGPHYR